MKIGIICATDAEYQALNVNLVNACDLNIAGQTIRVGTLFGKDVVLAQAGEGKVRAAVTTQTVILSQSPDFVMNVGVAGGLGTGVVTGHVVVAEDTVEYDYDCSAIGEEKAPHFKTNDKLSRLLYESSRAVLPAEKVHFGVICTADLFVAEPERASKIRDDFSALACEMEGAAVVKTCLSASIPACVLRCISDNANEQSHITYWDFRESAIRVTTNIVRQFLETL